MLFDTPELQLKYLGENGQVAHTTHYNEYPCVCSSVKNFIYHMGFPQSSPFDLLLRWRSPYRSKKSIVNNRGIP